MNDWKSDPNVFLDMKVKYAMLLGFLQGYAYAGKMGTPEYTEVLTKVDDEICELVAEIFNCGWAGEKPTLQEIVDVCEVWLDERFKVEGIKNED